MEKHIKEFAALLCSELAELNKIPSGRERSEQVRALAAWYTQRMSDFQHERLVHLVVMLFFIVTTGVTLSVAVLLPVLELLPGVELSVIAIIGCYSVACILLVVDVFYIRHYYFLENSIQKLYESESELFFVKQDSIDL